MTCSVSYRISGYSTCDVVIPIIIIYLDAWARWFITGRARGCCSRHRSCSIAVSIQKYRIIIVVIVIDVIVVEGVALSIRFPLIITREYFIFPTVGGPCDVSKIRRLRCDNYVRVIMLLLSYYIPTGENRSLCTVTIVILIPRTTVDHRERKLSLLLRS